MWGLLRSGPKFPNALRILSAPLLGSLSETGSLRKAWKLKSRLPETCHTLSYCANTKMHIFAQVDLLKKAIEKDEMAECTFAPRVSENPMAYGHTAAGESEKNGEHVKRQDFVQRMSQDAVEREVRLQKARSDQEKLMGATATFTPQLMRREGGTIGHHHKDKDRDQNNQDVFTRLALERTLSAQQSSDGNANAPIANLDVPKLRPKSASAPRKKDDPSSSGLTEPIQAMPFHDRIMRVAAERKAEFEKQALKLLEERDRENTFTPHLPSSSAVKVVTAENNFAAAKGKSEEELARLREERLKKDCTFQPKIGSSVVNTSGTSALPVHERLAREAEEVRKRQAQLEWIKTQSELKEATFKPNIPTNPDIQVDYTGEKKNVVRRLSTTQIEYDKLSKLREDKEMKECTFNPSINAKSEDLARAKHFDMTATTHHQFSDKGHMLGHSVFGRVENVEANGSLTASAVALPTDNSNSKLSNSEETKGSRSKVQSSKIGRVKAPSTGSKPKVHSQAQTEVLENRNSLKDSISKSEFTTLTRELKSFQKFPLSMKLVVESLLCILNITVRYFVVLIMKTFPHILLIYRLSKYFTPID